MSQNDNKCPKCGAPRFEDLDGGRRRYLRCKCELKQFIKERLRETVHPRFWKGDDSKRMRDWEPEALKPGKSSKFGNFLRAQQAIAVETIWRFAFEGTNDKNYPLALCENVRDKRTLYVRGPARSGKSLLLSSIKTLAAIKALSATDVDDEFGLLKADLATAQMFNKEGSLARVRLADKWHEPSLMTIQEVRSDSTINMGGNRVPLRFKHAQVLENLLARRRGAVVATSTEFLGSVSDSLGDVFRETFAPGDFLVLFAPNEADSIADALGSVGRGLIRSVERYQIRKTNEGKDEDRSTHDKLDQQEDFLAIDELFFFEQAFNRLKLPMSTSSIGAFGMNIASGTGKVSPEVRSRWSELLEQSRNNGLAHEEGIKRAMLRAVLACKPLSQGMTEGEMLATGRIISLASDEGALARAEAGAARLKEIMSGGRPK